MEVDKSRAALTSGETPLPLCGGEAELTSRAALTSGETPLPLCSRATPAPIFARRQLDFCIGFTRDALTCLLHRTPPNSPIIISYGCTHKYALHGYHASALIANYMHKQPLCKHCASPLQ